MVYPWCYHFIILLYIWLAYDLQFISLCDGCFDVVCVNCFVDYLDDCFDWLALLDWSIYWWTFWFSINNISTCFFLFPRFFETKFPETQWQTLLCIKTKPYSCKSVECNLFLRTQVLEIVWSFSTYESVGSLRSPKWMAMQNTINALGRGVGLTQCQLTPMNGLCEKWQFHIIFLWSLSTQWKYWRASRWLRH